MVGFDGDDVIKTKSSSRELLSQTFFVMFLGVLATAIASVYTFTSGFYLDMITSGSYIWLCIAELAVVFIFSLFFRKLSASIVTILFFGYAILTGVTFSTLLAIYDITSIAYAFVGSAAIFAVLAYIGKNTNKDLTKFGTILSVTLVVGIVLSLVNLFIGNSMLDIILNWVILFVFMGFTIYDMNKLTNLAEMGYDDQSKLHIYGAMELYLDFINIFIRLLQIIGRARD